MAGAESAQVSGEERAELARALPAYELGAALGRGTFAVVFAARHVRLGREVAIKRLSPRLLTDPAARDRFATEARLLASLDHPHIVRVHDYVEDDRVCALVMERLHGGTLAERAHTHALSGTHACAVAIAALHGLEHAHRHGVLHRDVKPENLLFGERELLKVADFGIAKVVGAQGARMTATAAVLGTPAYMAPEQVSSAVGPLSAATDVWAIGAVLYELLGGAPPFSRDGDLGEILLRRMRDDPRPLADLAPEIPRPLATVVMRALARDPAERHQTAYAFAESLEAAVGAAQVTATGIPIHRMPAESAGAETLPDAAQRPANSARADLKRMPPRPADTAPPTAPRNRRRLVGGAAALVGGGGVVAVLALAGGGEPGSAPQRAPTAATLTAPRRDFAGPLPGWPSTMALGYSDPLRGPAGVAERLGAGGLTYEAYGGDAAAQEDWSHAPSQIAPGDFAAEARRHGLVPYAIYYQLRALGRSGRDDALAPQLRRTLADPDLMPIYWRNVRAFLRSLGSSGKPAAVSVEPSVWALLEQNLPAARVSAVPALVGAAGAPELRGIPDTLPGVVRGWRALRDRHAPEVALGFGVTDYGANIDISWGLPSRTALLNAAREAGEYYLALGRLDFTALEIAYGEEGQNPDPHDVYSPAEKQGVVAFVREFTKTTGMPMTLESVPLGNSVSRTIDDSPYHWRDSWVEWLIGTDAFSGLRALRDAGVIGVQFGAASDDASTCPCDAAQDGVTNDGPRGTVATSADDDGGYLADRVRALRAAGGLPLRFSRTA